MNSNPKVFVVDDDPSVRDSIGMFLESAGYRVATFPTARAFMHVCKDAQGCVLLDVCMPGLNGLDVQDWMLTSRISMPVIFITGEAGDRSRTDAILSGAFGFLRKPLDPEELLDYVARALGAGVGRHDPAASAARIHRAGLPFDT